ncbi:MAG: 3-keto-disaccharide hydrolase [Chitinophagaceae bacterium]
MNKKIFLIISCFLSLAIANAQIDSTKFIGDKNFVWGDTTKPETTEFYSPVPPVVTPSKTPQDPPSDAIILFNGKNLDAWRLVKDTTKPADWIVSDGILTVSKKSGNIETKQRFMDYQLHLEWREPANIQGSGQARGNSGVFLASTGPGDDGYEVQILDCYNNKTYVDGQTAAVYKQGIPLANACKKPGEWQTYDIIWTAPRFDNSGKLLDSARVTVLHNGVLVQNNFALKGQTRYIGLPYYKPHGASPIKLQAHGDKSEPISYRNIWVREL